MKKWFVSFYIGLISVVAGIQITGQILGFAGIYHLWSAILLAIILTIVFYFWLQRTCADFLIAVLTPERADKSHRFLNIVGYASGVVLILVLLLLPLALWPSSGIYQELVWDAGLYHLPKAAELVIQHTTWDLTIDYGEYPWGYESLIAFSFLFSRSGMLIGLTHALITLLFTLSFFFLAARFSQIPRGALFFGITAVICSFDILRGSNINPWWVFRAQVFTIGKNDLYLSITILTLLLFSPFGHKGKGIEYSLSGMAVSSAMALSTKPNSAYIVILVYAVVLYLELSRVIKKQTTLIEFCKRWLPVGLLLLTGVLWAIRNLVTSGRMVSESALRIYQWSIINNLTNPYFYNYTDLYFKIAVGIVVLTVGFTALSRRFHWTVLAVLFVVAFSFIATPSSGFFSTNQTPSHIAWRFGVSLVAFELIALLLMVDPLMRWIFNRQIKPIEIFIAAGIVLTAGWGIYFNYPRAIPHEENTIVLRDMYREPVGVDGYFSAYDYVQKNIHNSTVWVENGLPFYVFGPELSNSVTRSRPADYIVFFQTPWINDGGYPETLTTAEWISTWQLIYEDREGRVYQRK